MRTPMLITVLLYIVAMPVVVQAGQARAVPEVGILLPVQRPDYDEEKVPTSPCSWMVCRRSAISKEKTFTSNSVRRGSLKTSPRWPPI